MSYAVEAKKRKFDRILEALTDGAASPSRTSLSSRNNASSTSLSQDAASDSSKRRRIGGTSKTTITTSSSTTSLAGHYLPSSRTAFLQRLETFRHVTQWHIPSTEPINATAWAKRGWTCVDTDTVYCGACKERLHVDLNMDNNHLHSESKDDEDGGQVKGGNAEDNFDMASEVYRNMVRRYQDLLVTGHAESCLWRKRGCDASIQRIEGLLNTNTALLGLRSRYDSIMTRPEEVPEVAPLPTTSGNDTEELERYRFDSQGQPNINALRLAICGWVRKSEDVIECRHCFRSLGLWLYRGDAPAMEKLDGVEDHLEYCPWRSAEAQDTELVVGSSHESNEDNATPKKERASGWMLVYQAVVKDNLKRRSATPAVPATPATPRQSVAFSESETIVSRQESLTPEQREKKMRDLLRRIKEIKKPFNVKGLLTKRKEKGKA
ncbi:hypothetical protein HRR83_006281 [Exophiala dermatitidis]|uniref:C3HC-type domain-containing protein n=2 Tax=Exophiala dermatitidis TaxID=5970 RepID=H6C9L1_EXODN|nr:uncharacterized protein HMPREF1120_07897 [Exophiala dermatitidis NIH/UT8656]KAJ4507307.1 hypothetical protein HRR75_006656 [Exophiala dermatitidis]EHY59920.1 hypothetical protein HMPREF1120_07897 [Exophiala dermatitidis NIH/UT8656]KAJ4509286.1 hypothetical protein HRR73_007140 [Exophiala dermatitidis]KAJ4509473.1 hypothetical protein HRR74_007254 [Exophiala dermatitidis]KAJ4530471.1 hypothetical protein HRR76_008181 [Exophiala dermatitidis]